MTLPASLQRLRWPAGLLIALAAGAALHLALRPAAPEAVRHAPASLPQTDTAALPPAAGQPAAAASDEHGALPWQATAAGATPSAPALHRLPTQQLQQQVADPVQRQQMVDRLQAQARQNEQAIDRMLLQLDQIQASGKGPPAAQLAQMRSHLRDVRRAQELARELAGLTTTTATVDNRARLARITDELKGIQARLATAAAQPMQAPTAGDAG